MNRTVGFRCELLDRHRNKKGDIELLPGGDVTQQADAVIKRTAKFSIKDNPLIAWESDLFRLSVIIDGQSFNLGVFIPSSPQKTRVYETYTRDITAYDQTLILSDDRITNRLTLTRGLQYTDVIGDLLLSAGITRYEVDPSGDTILVDKEYAAGTQKITIINELLSEINYNTLYADENGTMKARRYILPYERLTTHLYKTDEYSIIRPGLTTSVDFFGLPNVFIAVVSSPEYPAMRAEFVNDNPQSLLSTVRRGRRIVAEAVVLDGTPSQSALQGYVERMAAETSQVFETVSFNTAINPLHGTNDIVELHHPDTGVARFAETEWKLPLQAGAAMEHTGRRIVVL